MSKLQAKNLSNTHYKNYWFPLILNEELVKNENVIIGNIGTNNGVGYAEIVNQLSEKLINQFEERIKEKNEIILELKAKLSKYQE